MGAMHITPVIFKRSHVSYPIIALDLVAWHGSISVRLLIITRGYFYTWFSEPSPDSFDHLQFC